MGTSAVLQPSDGLRRHYSRRLGQPLQSPRQKPPLPSPSPPAKTPRSRNAGRSRMAEKPPSKALVMEKVRILKRGEEIGSAGFLSSPASSPAVQPEKDLDDKVEEQQQKQCLSGDISGDAISSPARCPQSDGPKFPSPETVYAGTGFEAASPPVCALPYPGSLLSKRINLEELASHAISYLRQDVL